MVMDGFKGAGLEPISPPPVGNGSQHRWPRCRYRGTQGSLGLLVSPGTGGQGTGTATDGTRGMTRRQQPLFDIS